MLNMQVVALLSEGRSEQVYHLR